MLQDFVKLAKWEDRGHYAQKQESDKAQRQLHKLVRDSQEVLKRPAAGVIGSYSAAMGFADVVKHQTEEQALDEKPAAKKSKAKVESLPWKWQDQVGLCFLHSLYLCHCLS